MNRTFDRFNTLADSTFRKTTQHITLNFWLVAQN
nr:MAG TPA: hypothetical protein [Bacteriophage sp.]